MKFSVLLPTRNRLELLKAALYSILNQDFEDWEVIVSDNFSDEDVSGYVLSLNDPRIKCFRTESFVPVTDNWNHALKRSSGDYVIMLGDDDCLMKGCLTAIANLLRDFPNPDFVYTSGFQYAYPGVLSWCLEGSLTVFGNASFLESKKDPFWLSTLEALKLVQDAMNFKVKFAYNMQYAIICRKFIEKIKYKGHFFQTSYPDYYAMTALMLKAERILAYPIPIVTVGISPKSFGFYYFNQREDEGVCFLNNSLGDAGKNGMQSQILLPGTKMNSYWLLSMEALRNNFSDEFMLNVNYCRYRLLQIVKVYKKFSLAGRFMNPEMKTLWNCMNWKEIALFGVPFYFLSLLLFTIPKIIRLKILNRLESLTGSHPSFISRRIAGDFFSMQDVFERVDPFAYHQDN